MKTGANPKIRGVATPRPITKLSSTAVDRLYRFGIAVWVAACLGWFLTAFKFWDSWLIEIGSHLTVLGLGAYLVVFHEANYKRR